VSRRLIRYLLIPLLVIVTAVVILFWTRNRDRAHGIAADDEKPQVYVQVGHGAAVCKVSAKCG
jgi:4-amino-4-deoxy-L-arabinose transferase-like glycosyltransferase